MTACRWLQALILGVAATWAATSAAADLQQQRTQFREALKALHAHHMQTFQHLAGDLKDYALYPYLRYNDLRARLGSAPAKEVEAFIDHDSDAPLAARLRARWLKLLGKRGEWHTYLANYTPQSDDVLRCYELQARIRTGRTDGLLADIERVWLTGESRPKECNPAFAYLYKSPAMTDKLVWQRIRLAMDAGSVRLARYLERRLPKDDRPWVQRWIEVYRNPERGLRDPALSQSTQRTREIVLYGVHRLARRDLDAASDYWGKVHNALGFSADQIALTQRYLALAAARQDHPDALSRLASLPPSMVNDTVQEWRLRTALENRDWQAVLRWTRDSAKQDAETGSLRWRYWHARALAATGNEKASHTIFEALAKRRDYYGFLAADRLGQPYHMIDRPIRYTDAEEAALMKTHPGLVRARELYFLNMNTDARREWYWAIRKMNDRDMEIAAALAHGWGWYDRAIIALGRAGSYDDLKLRFPMPYHKMFIANAHKGDLDPALLFSVARAESAFMEDARSPVGALGLMQVMPHTGRITARKIGIRLRHSRELLGARKNVPIGSAYLRQMLKRYNGNLVLAAAAYNAGPRRVAGWLPKGNCMDADMWVDAVPFGETSLYVKRILFYTAVYEWRMGETIEPMEKRLAVIPPKSSGRNVALECPLGHNEVAEAHG